MPQPKEAFTACILHPDDVLELLYTYERKEDAVACADAYCRRKKTQDTWSAAGYNNTDKRVRIKILHHVVHPVFTPEKHYVGLRLEGDVEGDFTQ